MKYLHYVTSSPNCLTEVIFTDCIGHRCHEASTCVDLEANYRCECPPGLSGTYCDEEGSKYKQV